MIPGGDRVLRALVEVAARVVPGRERARWRTEWRADLRDLRQGGMTFVQGLRWAWGVHATAARMRLEEVTMEGWGRQLRYAVRGLLRRPGFTVVAVTTLGLGIGATSSIFSVVNGVVLEPLPYPDADELVDVSSAFPAMDFHSFWISPPEYLALQERALSFEVVGAYRGRRTSVGGGDRPERVPGAVASAELFEALAVEPRLGRTYTPEEDVAGAAPVAVLSWALWNRAFGRDPGILGRDIEVNGVLTTVVGVMPRGFGLADQDVEIWLPLGLDPADPGGWGSHYLNLVARLADGVTVEAASRELGGLVAGWEEAHPEVTHAIDPESHFFVLTPLHDEMVGEVRTALWILLGAVLLVLLIACANVANLLLARAEGRQKEVSVRVALGAGRARLVRQFLTEGVVLSVLGALLGLGVAWGSLEALRSLGPGELPRLREVELDGSVLLFTAGLAVLTGVLFGLAPVRYIVGGGVSGTLREGGTRSTAGGRRIRLQSLLVVAEMALALILALGSGLLLRSFAELTAVDPGFEPRGLLTAQVALPEASYPEPGSVVAFHDRLHDRLEALPGVTRVASMSGLPPLRDLAASDVEIQGVEPSPEGPPHNVDYIQTVQGPYLETMGIEVRRGRGFEPRDRAGSVPVALVNERLARTFFPDADALGQRMRLCCGGDLWFQVVGVVEDVRQGGLDRPAGTEIYFLQEQLTQAYGWAIRSMHLAVETPGDPGSLGPEVRRTVASLDPSLPVAAMRPMREVLERARARPRFLTTLLAAFSGVALLLAAVGTYGVMSFAVARRAKEMGIRMALGAEAGAVRRLVLRRGLVLAGVGLGLGVAGAWWLTGLLESLLFGIAARDPLTFSLVPLLLVAVAAAASWIPAHRATRVDPVEVLRQE